MGEWNVKLEIKFKNYFYKKLLNSLDNRVHYTLLNYLHNKRLERKIMVPKVGLEPTLCCQNRILSPARLPISPLRHIYSIDIDIF